jgi:tRNA(adenine34) deaminase
LWGFDSDLFVMSRGVTRCRLQDVIDDEEMQRVAGPKESRRSLRSRDDPMPPTSTDIEFMQRALTEARAAADAGEVPVGSVVVHNGKVIGHAGNRTIRDQDPSAHAEMLAIRQAAAVLGSWRLTGCTLYVTLEPCAMCAGAMVLGRVERVVFGAWDEAAGMAGSAGDILRHPRLYHRPQVMSGVLADESARLLRDFFRRRRDTAEAPLDTAVEEG